jgi:hypothetical protein
MFGLLKKPMMATVGFICFIWLLIAIGFFGYLPSKTAVAREFERRHPGWQVLDVEIGGGDEDGCSYVLKYKSTTDKTIHEAMWSVACSGQILGWRVQGEILDITPLPTPD